ncbi:MAG: hypothetical protein RI911_252 [Candidatus Parcubacteria bacterium]|jgi:hypothetical protein
MARGDDETQELEGAEGEPQESESLIGDEDDLFGDDAAVVAADVEELDKHGRYADEDVEDDDEEEEEDDGVDYDEM